MLNDRQPPWALLATPTFRPSIIIIQIIPPASIE
jgi:hypothetical protein